MDFVDERLARHGATSRPVTPTSGPIYDRIGRGYAQIRQTDPRLAARIRAALGDARSVLNVGAGSGSYEPTDRWTVAVEPSAVMLRQHPGRRRVQASAEALPFADRAFDAAMAIMTVHHWPDLAVGLAELRRVAARQIVFTWDPRHPLVLWLVAEYLPEIGDIERARFAPIDTVVAALGAHTVETFPIPHDFADGYQPAFWRRPEAYLSARLRAASSTFAQLPDHVVEPAMARLRRDLERGEWHRRHADLLTADAMDYGYRLVVAG
jgi:SAM-dependent methyltransferase